MTAFILMKQRLQQQLPKLLTVLVITVVIMVWQSEASALGKLYKCGPGQFLIYLMREINRGGQNVRNP